MTTEPSQERKETCVVADDRASLVAGSTASLLERWVAAQNRPLELLQGGAGLDAELVDQYAPCLAVACQRLCMSSAPVESDHQLTARPFAQGLFDDERFQLRDQAALAPELQLRVDPILECREAKLGQPAHRGSGERQPVELGERRTAPERKRTLEQCRPSGDITL